MTRNQATVWGSTSSNKDTAIAAPTYCDNADSTKSASGVAVSRYRPTGPGRWSASESLTRRSRGHLAGRVGDQTSVRTDVS